MERATAASSMDRHSPQAMAPVGGDNGNDGPSLEGLQEILESADGHSTAALNHYIQLLTLAELKKLSKRRVMH